MNVHVTTIKAYRIFVRMGGHIYYANRTPGVDLPTVRWVKLAIEYPDHFSMRDVRKIIDHYSDQKPEYYDLRVRQQEDEDNV